MRLTKSTLVVLSLALAVTAFTVPAFGNKAGDKDAVATITEMDKASVMADRAGDSSFVEK
jgi:hypothetical protein